MKPTERYEYECSNCHGIMAFTVKQSKRLICVNCNNKVDCNEKTEVKADDKRVVVEAVPVVEEPVVPVVEQPIV